MKHLKGLFFALLALMIVGSYSPAAAQQKKKKAKTRTEAELTDTYWRLYEMDGKLVETPADSREVYIKLIDKKSQLEGYAGCNIITGNFELGKETLTFNATATLRMCDDMTMENYVFKALNDADRYQLNGLNLLLYKGTYLLAIFEAKYYEE